uniref:Uncharacterized protein n=1 Tax=Arundo donax TaxID=35708 RepID=A0A0A9B9W9_ARUDO
MRVDQRTAQPVSLLNTKVARIMQIIPPIYSRNIRSQTSK